MTDHSNPTRGEARDRRFRTAARFGLLLLVAVAAVIVVGALITRQQTQSAGLPSTGEPTSSSESVEPTPLGPSGEDLKNLRATEDAQLNTYGWVDRKNNIARIPIERAMDLFAQQNQPTQPPGELF